MRTIRSMMLLLLAIVWLPVTSHCLIFESVANFDLLSCCAHENPTPEPHQEDCATDACAIVEGAQYKSSFQRVTIPPLAFQVAVELPALHDAALTITPIDFNQSNAVLVQLPVTWQFSARTALSPRAPSFVS